MKSSEETHQLEEVFEHLKRHSTLKYQNPLTAFSLFDYVLIWIALGMCLLGAALGMVARFRHSVAILDYALIPLLLAIIAGWVLELRGIVGSLKLFAQPVRSIIASNVERAKSDYEFLEELRSYPAPVVDYVSQRLSTAVQHVRGRVTIVAGPIDKVGLLPLFIGWISAEQSYLHEATRISIVMATAVFGVFYTLSVIIMLASYRAEELQQLVQFVLDDKKASRSQSRGAN